MPSPNEPVTPTPFEVAQPTPTGTPGTPGATGDTRQRPGWVVPALGGLLLLVVLVIFWLPGRLQAPDTTSTPAQANQDSPAVGASSTGAAAKPAAQTEASPWSDAQLARLRKEAQEVLAELLDIQFALEEQGVQQWAPQRFAEAGAIAAAGDELYRSREFESATENYRQGLEILLALQEALPEAFQERLEQARQAIEQGDPGAAASALEVAAVMEPDSPELASLQQRLAVLPQLQALMQEAAVAEEARELDSAQQLLQQAAALDGLHQRAASELARVTEAARRQHFNEAMSEGYAALDGKHFDSARKAFRAAAKLQPGSDEAGSALREVEAAETAHRLATLDNRGRKNEQQEQWQSAVEAYEQAQKIDTSVLFASEGLARSRARARLDKQFSTTIDEPARLSDIAVAEAATDLLQQAKRITPRGPLLERQISSLEILLRQANTSIPVTLRSDMETEVIVYKVARLGRFAQHQLTLRPGTYTAVGTRNGYRDVRHSFTVRHDSDPAPITIACTEPI